MKQELKDYEITNGNVAIHKFMGNEIKSHYAFGEGYYVHKKLVRNDFAIPRDWDLLKLTDDQKGKIFTEEWISVDADFDGLKYHGSWNWLIPVIDKIESLGYDSYITTDVRFVEDTDGQKKVTYRNAGFTDVSNKLVASGGGEDVSRYFATFTAVVNFINFYNSLITRNK